MSWLRRALTAATLLAFVFPIVFLVMISLKTQSDIASGGFFPETAFWQNYSDAWQSIAVGTYLRNSVTYAVFGSLLTLIIAVPATHAITRFRLGGKALPAVILASYVAPPIVALFPLFFLLKALGLMNTHAGLILVYGVMNLPVAFWLLSSFVQRLPVEIEEAARVDGAGYITVLWRIVVPLLLPGIVSTGIICMILAYNEFLLASFLTRSESTQTLPVGLSLYQGDRQLRFGQMAVASLIGIAPVYVLATIAQKGLVQGLTAPAPAAATPAAPTPAAPTPAAPTPAAALAAVLAALVDTLLPGDERFPPAAVLGIQSKVAERIASTAGADTLDEIAAALPGDFAALATLQRVAAVRQFESAQAALFEQVRMHTYLAYYEHPLVVQAVASLGRPYIAAPQPTGYPMVAFGVSDEPTHQRGHYIATDAVARVSLDGVPDEPLAPASSENER